jgi:hypothetical protein
VLTLLGLLLRIILQALTIHLLPLALIQEPCVFSFSFYTGHSAVLWNRAQLRLDNSSQVWTRKRFLKIKTSRGTYLVENSRRTVYTEMFLLYLGAIFIEARSVLPCITPLIQDNITIVILQPTYTFMGFLGHGKPCSSAVSRLESTIVSLPNGSFQSQDICY